MIYYRTCHYGDQFYVGLSGNHDEVTEDINLAHNLFNAGTFYDIFDGRINFASKSQFIKFLIYKIRFRYRGISIRDAAKTARRILTEQTTRVSFMEQLRQQTRNYYYNVSTYEAH